METINNSNYELWLVRYADGEMAADERKAVEQWLEAHPEAAEELALYNEAPRLERDEEVRYAAPVPQATRPLWPAWRRAAAAAVVLLILVPVALRVATPHEGGTQVASLPPTLPQVLAEPDSAAAKPAAAPVTTPAVRRPADWCAVGPADTSAETQGDPVPVEELIPSRPMTVESVLLAEELPADEPVMEISALDDSVLPVLTPAAEELIYVDNLFTVDSGDAIQQRLMAVNETIKGRLQGTYLGRRLARRMPTGEELLEYTDGLRERTPQGVRLVTDMVLAYNDSNR